MQENGTSHTHPPDNGWQVLGQLDLPVGPGADGTIHAWLTGLLDPLQLHTDFVSKVSKSAQDAVARAFEAEDAPKFGHIHLMICVPGASMPAQQTWGFFRIEKTTADSAPSSHAIEFYLYVESE